MSLSTFLTTNYHLYIPICPGCWPFQLSELEPDAGPDQAGDQAAALRQEHGRPHQLQCPGTLEGNIQMGREETVKFMNIYLWPKQPDHAMDVTEGQS